MIKSDKVHSSNILLVCPVIFHTNTIPVQTSSFNVYPGKHVHWNDPGRLTHVDTVVLQGADSAHSSMSINRNEIEMEMTQFTVVVQ